jgi:hypothetical protein
MEPAEHVVEVAEAATGFGVGEGETVVEITAANEFELGSDVTGFDDVDVAGGIATFEELDLAA